MSFLLCAPILVLYTAGYRFHFPSHQFIKTGSVSLSTIPKQASLFLDGEYQGTTPLLLDHLHAGSYLIRIEKNGYLPFEKRILVKETNTTLLENIHLFMDESPDLVIPFSQKISISPSGKEFIYESIESGWIELWKSSKDLSLKKLLLRLPQSDLEDLALSWSFSGHFLSVQEKRKQTTTWTVIDLNQNQQQKIQWNGQDPLKVLWDPDLDDILYATFPFGLFEFSLSRKTTESLIVEPLMGIHRGNDLLVISDTEKNQSIFYHYKYQDSPKLITSLPKGSWIFLQAPLFYALLFEKNSNQLVLINTLSTQNPLVFSSQAFKALWNPENPYELLYFNDFEIHIYHLTTGMDELITRLSHPIKEVIWYPKTDTILYEEDQKIYAIDKHKTVQAGSTLLVAAETIETFWLSPDGKILNFIGTQNKKTGVFERRLQK